MSERLLEVWGGAECTVTRINDTWRDQFEETGHAGRPDDLAAIRSLGIETLRYPILMERVAPDRPGQFEWGWTDQRCTTMRDLGFRPIAGLLHHGSGPRYTSLLDPALPDLLAGYAAAVARRYPWIDRFTPINEPLTTARFSALYGHWYPHATDFGCFVQAVLIQCKATLLAMRAIRQVTPRATLVQTEDVGLTLGTIALWEQTNHDNQRRWLSLDLLCGRLDRQHPWWNVLRQHGIAETDLDLFLDGEGAPDVIGINHYLTSERFLDEDLAAYPGHLHGGNGRNTYADTEAVRIRHLARDLLGPKARMREVWDRYRRPIAVTEVHHGCTREEQLRWLAEVWGAAEEVRQEGVDIRAVTAWALFGSVDWNSLLTKRRGAYEPGAFDVRAPVPRPTALAGAVSSLARRGSVTHPVLASDGWWHRPDRFYGIANPMADPMADHGDDTEARPLLICGSGTPLAQTFAHLCVVRGLRHILVPGPTADDHAETDIRRACEALRPWAVVDAGFDTSVIFVGARARTAASRSAVLARACRRAALPLVTFSSDQVFAGNLGRSYLETDATSPTGSAGRLLVRHEQECATHPAALIIRTGPLLTVPADDIAASGVSEWLRSGAASAETIVSPSYMPDLVHAVLDLLIDGETGVWHLPNPGQIAVAELAVRLSATAVTAKPRSPARPPEHNVALASCRGWPMPSLDEALVRFARDAAADRAEPVELQAAV